MTAIAIDLDPSPQQRTVFGHPRGLLYIAGTELWDRISFHGMQALLVLYMVGQLLLPGHVEHIVGFHGFRAAIEAVTGPLSVEALATQIFGLYVGLVYFMPVFGGWLGDRVLGRTRAVSLGALSMTAGHFCMAFDELFLLAMRPVDRGRRLPARQPRAPDGRALRPGRSPARRGLPDLWRVGQPRRLHRPPRHRRPGAGVRLARRLRLRRLRHADRPRRLSVGGRWVGLTRPAGETRARRAIRRCSPATAG